MINTPDKLEKAIIDLVTEAEEGFLDGLSKTETNLFRSIKGILKDLEVGPGNRIRRNAKNRALLNRLKKNLRAIIMTDAYKGRVNKLVSFYDLITGANDEYLGTLVDAFKPNKSLTDAIKSEAIEQTVESLTGAGLDENLINPVKNILNQNITTGGNVFELEEQLRLQILGNSERLGSLTRYTKQITRDALNQYSANYNLGVSDDLGLEWFFYTRGTVQDTREFCRQRNGKYYHRKEVEAWGNIPKWQGRIPGTNSNTIFIYRGGYNCMHQITSVSSLVVPKSAKERAIKQGYIKAVPVN